jgi:hypothetical protein
VEERVKPGRMKLKRKAYRDRWWQFCEPQLEAHRLARGCSRVLGISRVSKFVAFEWIDPNQVIAAKIAFVVADDDYYFGVLQSSVHEWWAVHRGSKHGVGGSFTYSPVNCLRTFPFPLRSEDSDEVLRRESKSYLHQRTTALETSNIGLTELYNRFHEPEDQSPEIKRLRDLQVNLDEAVIKAYRWSGIDLEHDWIKTVTTEEKKNKKTGKVRTIEKVDWRFTISENAKQEVLRRLLKLNHEIYEREVAEGLHEKKRKSKEPSTKTKSKRNDPKQPKKGGGKRKKGRKRKDSATIDMFGK